MHELWSPVYDHYHRDGITYDGTVKCFAGAHTPLAVVAVLVLASGVILSVFIMAVILEIIKGHVVTGTLVLAD